MSLLEPNTEASMENKNACTVCDKKFSRKDNMQKHMRVVHGQEPIMLLKNLIKCSDCLEFCENMNTLRNHMTSVHSITMETEELDFPTLKDFFLWKESTEKKSLCSYVLHRAAYVSASGTKTSHYMCHRSGFHKTKSTGKRYMKSLGSKKLNGFCPAEMIVISSSTDVKVQFHKSHYGHDVGYGHFLMTQNERKKIANFLVWKNELEKRNYCKYIIQGPPKVIQPSKDKINVYHCDSSNPTSKERKSACAAKDTCPSMISAIENAKNHTIKVEYWNTHIGHIIPVQGDELDAAIGSLQTTEIVIDEQSYQSVEQDSENAIYFLTESNDSSFSESYVKETQRKQPPTLFQNNGASSPKSMPRKFSFKKDPSKKSVSFSGSLASVACMKASVKKDSPTPTTSVTSSAIETSDSKSTPTTSIASSAIETPDSQSTSEMKDLKCSKGVKKKTTAKSASKKSKKEGKDSVPSSNPSIVPTSEFASIAPVSSSSQIKVGNAPLSQSVLSNLKLLVNDGQLNGQFILLNSLESQNGQQNLILCPVNGNLPSGGQPITVAAEAKGQYAKQGEGKSLESQQGGKGSVISSVQNVLTLAESVPCPAGVERINLPPGPSILKKPGRQAKSKELKSSSPTETPKARKRATRKKLLSVGQKLSLLGATTSSSTNVINQISTSMSPSIKGIITVNSPMKTTSLKPFPLAGNKVLPNSLTPGVSYIQINNTLFPINSLAGPNLNTNYAMTSLMSSAQTPHSSKSPLSFSALAQPATTLVMNTTKSSVVGTVANAKSKLPPSNLPVIVISQLGNNPTTMPMPPLSSVSARKSIAKSFTPSPMTKSMQTITSSILPQIGKIRSSLIQTNAQFIPSPRLLAVSHPCQRHAVPPSFGLRCLGPNTPTAVNTVPLNTVQLPSSSSVANPPTPTKTKVNPTSKSTNVNSVVSNTAPISSAPAITIPSTPIAHPQKPGAYIFESSGDLYVLEPIEDTKSTKSDLSIKKDEGKITSSEAKSETECTAIDNDAAEDSSETDSAPSPANPEIPDVSPKFEFKIESKPKKPKICSTFSDGKKIAALPQKRRMKEDDSEILKKIKYYNLEMKYLSSQAECKRLKLELARTNMRHRENISREPVPMTLDQDSTKEETEIKQNTTLELSDNPLEGSDEFVIDQLTDSLLKKIEEIETNKILNRDNDSQNELNNQSAEKELKGNVEISLEEKTNQREFEIANDELPMDYEVVNTEMSNDIIVDQSEEGDINADMGENDVINCQESEDKDINIQEIEVKAISSQEIEEKSMDSTTLVDKSLDNNDSLFMSVDSYEIMDRTIENSQAEIKSMVDETIEKSINNSETIDSIANTSETINEYIDFSENQPEISSSNVNDGQESSSKSGDPIQTIEEESTNLQVLIQEQAMEINDYENDQYISAIEDVQYFDSTKSNEEQEVLVNPCEDQATEETLKELEIQYGNNSSDIYTMIRTSVLRSLYADMKELCQENKKLFEELQSLKSHGESYEVVVEEAQIEEL